MDAMPQTLAGVLPRERPRARSAAVGDRAADTARSAQGWAALPAGADVLRRGRRRPARRARGRGVLPPHDGARPPSTCNGILGGKPGLKNTTVVGEAQANFTVRLAPGQDRRSSRRRSSVCCARPLPTGANGRGRGAQGSTRPGSSPPDAPRDQDRAGRVRAARSASGRSSTALAGRCRSSPRSPTRGSRRSSPASPCPRATSTPRTSACSSSTSRAASRRSRSSTLALATSPETGFMSPLAAELADDVLERFLRYVRIDTQSASAPTARRRRRSSSTSRGCSSTSSSRSGSKTCAWTSSATSTARCRAPIARPDRPDRARRHVARRDRDERAPAGPRAVGRRPDRASQRTRQVLDPAEICRSCGKVGHDIVTTDGTTLLGADDKAGVAEIMARGRLSEAESRSSSTRRSSVCFTTDEEVGGGADHLDLERFGAKYAYTLDGSELGEIEAETFNASRVVVTIRGSSTHPGTAKGKLVNAVKLAADFVAVAAARRALARDDRGARGLRPPDKHRRRRGGDDGRADRPRPRRGKDGGAPRADAPARRRDHRARAARARRGRGGGAVPEHARGDRRATRRSSRRRRRRSGGSASSPCTRSSAAAPTARGSRIAACRRRTSSPAATSTTRAASGRACRTWPPPRRCSSSWRASGPSAPVDLLMDKRGSSRPTIGSSPGAAGSRLPLLSRRSATSPLSGRHRARSALAIERRDSRLPAARPARARPSCSSERRRSWERPTEIDSVAADATSSGRRRVAGALVRRGRCTYGAAPKPRRDPR